MVGVVNSASTVGSSLEKKRAVGENTDRGCVSAKGREGPPRQKQKMLKMNERTHYVL